MMNSRTVHLCCKTFVFLSFLAVQSLGLNRDGLLLLSFKNSILKDPFFVLQNWNSNDELPCSWTGIICSGPEAANSNSRVVISLSLRNSQLLGSIPFDLGLIENLQSLNLSNNSLNGSLPLTLFNATKLQFLDLSNNLISGEVPESIGQLVNLQVVNFSDNALAGKLPSNLTSLNNLTVVSLKNNYFSGNIPSGFNSVQVLDLSSNLLNGSLPSDFGGNSLRSLNISYNRLTGSIPTEFSEKIPADAILDLSFNNLSGEIPQSEVLMNQKRTSFAGNPNLCGQKIKNPCPIASSLASPPNDTSADSPPAIAAIPKTLNSPPETNSTKSSAKNRTWVKPGTIIGIVLGDILGIAILFILFSYIYQSRKKKAKQIDTTLKNEANLAKEEYWSSSSSESRGFTRWSCLRKKGKEDEGSESTDQSDGEDGKGQRDQRVEENEKSKRGTLMTVDGEKELELETLLKASAYILGATGSSIMYKAVLEDGTTLAVRRIGENNVKRFKDFENQVKIVAKLVHPNLIRVLGFYWGVDEKLIIYDFVPNGSLANARYRKVGSSPCHLPWESRLRIAKGVARGLAYLHEKKHVHGNLKPSNILLGNDLEPKIGDFGLEKLLTGDSSHKSGGSARNFGSKRSTASRDSFQDFVHGPSPGPSPSPSPSSIGCLSLYHAPESLRSIKPNPKWDVYSFGVILLELLTGKVIIVLDEMGYGLGLAVEDKNRALRMVDVVIRADVEGKEDALLACFKLGYSCASSVPQKRPSMKEVLQILEKISNSSSSSYYYSH